MKLGTLLLPFDTIAQSSYSWHSTFWYMWDENSFRCPSDHQPSNSTSTVSCFAGFFAPCAQLQVTLKKRLSAQHLVRARYASLSKAPRAHREKFALYKFWLRQTMPMQFLYLLRKNRRSRTRWKYVEILKCELHQEGVDKTPWMSRAFGFCGAWASFKDRLLAMTEICSGNHAW